MSKLNNRFVRIGFLSLLTVCVTATSRLDADDAKTARNVLAAGGISTGLCAHIGAGRDASPGLTAELAANSKLLVHGICWDSRAIARARTVIDAKKVNGQASVEKITGPKLPYVRHLCNMIVVEDAKALTARGVGRDELMRVLAPGGMLCVMKNGRWTRTVAPRPKGMDDWTHPHHAPDGNLVFKDRMLRFPIGLRWIAGIPKSINKWASVRGWVLSGGRCYIVSSSVAENLAPGIKDKTNYLICRDAFNGLERWRLPLGTSESGEGLYWRNVSPLAADEKRVYVAGKDQVMIIDGATGKVVHTVKTSYKPERLVVLDKTLVLSCWSQRDATKAPFERGGLWGPWVNTTSKGSVEAYDAETGKQLWKLEYPGFSLFGSEGSIYLLTRDANPATANNVIAIDVRSGKERWRVGHKALGEQADLQLDLVGPGFVAVSKRSTEELKVLSSKTGKVLWSKQYGSVRPGHWKKNTSYRFTALVNGELWCSSYKYKPLTGEVIGKLPSDVPRVGLTICVSPIIVGNVFCHSRRCRFLELRDSSDSSEPLRKIVFNAARGGCIQGMTPANGMFYTSQNNCGCEPGQILGFLAFGPNGELPSEKIFARPRPVQRGPAMDDAKPGPIAADAWPMQRANAERNGSTAAAAPETLDILWQASVAPRSSGPMKAAWDERLAPVITPPVVAGGRVFVAGTETGQVKAFDAIGGKAVWTVSLGSRIDSAPTIIGNLCVVGAHDGWVYALTTDKGALAWRTRVAPVEQRMVVNGRVESTWPAVGSVLTHDGKIFAHAGRGSEADGGIAVVQLDGATGKTIWAGMIAPGPKRRVDLLRVVAGSVVCNTTGIDPTSGISQTRQVKAGPRGGPMLDGYLGRFKMRGFSATASNRAVAGNHTVIASALPTGGEIQLASKAIGKAKGKQIASCKLDSAPICDALAVAGGKVFVALEDGRILCLGSRK
jgi:outer membrane protein assembly factor BamB